MKLLWNDKDGGKESKGWIWGIEIKSLFSILIVRFAQGTRPVYHSHAFSAISWLLRGELRETLLGGSERWYRPSFRPILTPIDIVHQVRGIPENSWAITFRGPWARYWQEFDPARQKWITLTHGRKEVA